MKYFKNVSSFDDLKNQYRALLKKHHPDAGGDAEVMKQVNIEYESLFPLWKQKKEAETDSVISETAGSTRQQFYTEFGWEGKNHSWNRSLKEVAAIVRAYVKEKYPLYKFSVRTSYASMCQELHVDLKESPVEIYKEFDELTYEEKQHLIAKMQYNGFFELNSWSDTELKSEFERIWKEHGNFFKCLNKVTQKVIDDVDGLVKSYNYEDCDGMIDYFSVDFYYFGCAQNNGINIKIVPKTPRIQKPAKTSVTPDSSKELAVSERFTVHKDVDTRDNSEIWIVKINETLSKDDYIRVNNSMKKIGGYYSRYKHGFLFRFEPSAEQLKGIA